MRISLAPRVVAFVGVAMLGKVSTTNNLRKRGLTSKAISNLYVMCGKERDSIDHLFTYCEFSHSLCSFLMRYGVLWSSPGSLAEMIEAWRYSSLFKYGLILWRLIPLAILWLV